MNIKMPCVINQGGYTVRQVIVDKTGKLYYRFGVDEQGCYQLFDTNHKHGLYRLSFDMFQKHIIYTDMHTMTPATAVVRRDMNLMIDPNLLTWLKEGGESTDALLAIHNEQTSKTLKMIEEETKPMSIDAKSVIKGWSAGSILRGVNQSFITWVNELIVKRGAFIRVNTDDVSCLQIDKPINLQDELFLNLCSCEPQRRVMPDYKLVKELVSNNTVARTLFNSRIKHCDLREHDQIPDYIVLAAVRYGNVVPNQIAYLYQGSNETILECLPHDDENTLNIMAIPRTVGMTKVVVVTRKPVVMPGGKQSVGYFVDVYHNKTTSKA